MSVAFIIMNNSMERVKDFTYTAAANHTDRLLQNPMRYNQKIPVDGFTLTGQFFLLDLQSLLNKLVFPYYYYCYFIAVVVVVSVVNVVVVVINIISSISLLVVYGH